MPNADPLLDGPPDEAAEAAQRSAFTVVAGEGQGQIETDTDDAGPDDEDPSSKRGHLRVVK